MPELGGAGDLLQPALPFTPVAHPAHVLLLNAQSMLQRNAHANALTS